MGSLSGLISLLSLVVLSAINIGDRMPSFTDGTQWVKGNAPAFEKSITVVEIWKTTCSICKGQISHMSSLQKAYGDRISIVAITSDPIDVLNQFMKEHNDEISYTVGHVSKEVMSKLSDGTPGVPYCYIIDRNGNILWQCHAAAIDDMLERILNGWVDIEKLKQISILEKALDILLESSKTEIITQADKELLAVDPSNLEGLQVWINIAKYNEDPALMKGMFDQIPMSALSSYNANMIASLLISESDFSYRYPEAAIKFSDYALKKKPGNSDYVNTRAKLLYSLGDIEAAIAWQKKAVNLAPDNRDYQETLDYYLLFKKLRSGMKTE